MSHDDLGRLKRWALGLMALQLLVSTGVGALTSRIVAQAETRAIAEDEVRKAWVARLEAETRRIATEAASAAARQAVVDVVTPIAVETAAHRAMDDQRQHDVERRVEALEAVITGPPPRPRR